MSVSYWQVAVNAPFFEYLTYECPPELDLKAGQAIEVPLGRRKAFGVAISPGAKPENADLKIKPISRILHDGWTLPKAYFEWLEWIWQYYVYPPGLVFELGFPQSEKVAKRPRSDVLPKDVIYPRYTLNSEQQKAFDAIALRFDFSTHLIHGVTGSGKTEIYLELFEHFTKQEGQGLFLLPEISLTPQMLSRFSARFQDKIAVIHSQLTPAQRAFEWQKATSGQASIVIGARSAIFCPLPNLKLIVVDEEHDGSFKQDTKLRYHARSCAIMLAKLSNVPVVLGSATPSLESWLNSENQKFQKHVLYKRAKSTTLPSVELIDMRIHKQEAKPSMLPTWLSPKLQAAIEQTLDRQEQVALFLNRRGFASIVFCDSCGFHHECPNCDISLTLHHHQMLVCHYCNYQESLTDHCPSCKEGVPKPYGLGTEQVEKDLHSLFPNARIARIDRDEITHVKQLEEVIRDVEQRKIDILVGTQMIAKGLDFPSLKLVGFILADIGLNMPDFRAQERAFQLLHQMAGRAGRHASHVEDRGQVLVQTYVPDNPVFQWLQAEDFGGFMTQELAHRAELGYPPHGRLVAIHIQGRDLSATQKAASLINSLLNKGLKNSPHFANLQILGPSEAPIARIRNRFRYQVLLKAANSVPISKICLWMISQVQKAIPGVEIHVDVDPQHLL